MNLIPSTLPSEQLDFAQLVPSAALPGCNPVPTSGIAAPALGFEQVIAALQPAAPVTSQPSNLLATSSLAGEVQPPAAAVAERPAGDVAIVAPFSDEAVGATETQPITTPAVGGKRGAGKADRTRATGDFGIRAEEDGHAKTRKNAELPLCPTFDPLAAGAPVAPAPVSLELAESVEVTSDEDASGTMTFDDRNAADEGEETLAFSASNSSSREAVQPARLHSMRFETAAFAPKPGEVLADVERAAADLGGSFATEVQTAQQLPVPDEATSSNETGRGVAFAKSDSPLPSVPSHAIVRRAADVALPRPTANVAAPSPSHFADRAAADDARLQAGKSLVPVAIDTAGRPADVTSVALPVTSGEVRGEAPMPEAMGISLPHAADKPLAAREMSAAEGRSETQQENFAAMTSAAEPAAREPKTRGTKISLSAEKERLVKHATSVGTDVANSSVSMSLRTATPTLPHPVPEYTAAAAIDGVAATEAAAQQSVAFAELSPEAVSEAHRAVEVVLRAVDQVSGREQNSVKLDFAIGDIELSVRVERRADEVATTFTTDSSELRTALAHEWQSLSAATAERPVRLAQPVFTGSDSPSDSYLNQQSGGQSQRDGARNEQAVQQGWERRFHGGVSGSRAAEQAPVVSPLAAFAPAGTALRLNLFA